MPYLGLHEAQTSVHRPYNWVVADETARDALVVTADDVHKIALQLDDASVWTLTDDSPMTWAQVGGGGGAAITTSAFGSPPSSPTAGDLWLPSDSVYILRYTGSAWAPWGPIFPATDPTTPSWAWVNQGSASVATANGGVYLSAPANLGAGWRIRKIAVPSAPYSRRIGFLPQLGVESNVAQAFGIVLRESSSGKLYIFYIVQSGTTGSIRIQKWDDLTTVNSTPYDKGAIPKDLRYLHIDDNNTNHTFSWSADGVHKVPLLTESRTTFITPNEIGFAVYNQSTVEDCGALVLDWG